MIFRSFTPAVVLVFFLAVGCFVPRSTAQTVPRPELSVDSLKSVRAKFFARIREMLAEAKALESVGKPGEAMLLGVRASRMLNVIGGENVWPRARKDAGISPAEYLAVLAERYGPDVLTSVRAELPSPEKSEARYATEIASLAAVSVKSRPASTKPAVEAKPRSGRERSDSFSRFPELPAKSRSWVPVGGAVVPADDWEPISNSKIRSLARVDSTVLPSPVLGEFGSGQRFREKFEGGGVSERHVAPISIDHVSRDRSDSAAIDSRGDEDAASQERPVKGSPYPSTGSLNLRADVQLMRVPVGSSQKPAPQELSSIGSGVAGASSEPDSSGPRRIVTADFSTDSFSLWFATLAGACGGVLLVLAGSILVRRFVVPLEGDVVAESNEKESSVLGSQHTVEGITEAMVAASISGDENAETPATVTPSPETGEPDDVKSRGVTAEKEPSDAAGSNSHVEPVVPFRVIGTSVVLGEAESTRVDEELQRRREKILQRVLDENSGMQRRLDEQGDERSRGAA